MSNDLLQYKNNLKKYDQIIVELNNKKIVEETNLKHVKEQHEELINEIKKLGLDPNDLENVIDKKTNELKSLIEKLDKLVPEDGSIPENVAERIEKHKNMTSIESDWDDFLND